MISEGPVKRLVDFYSFSIYRSQSSALLCHIQFMNHEICRVRHQNQGKPCLFQGTGQSSSAYSRCTCGLAACPALPWGVVRHFSFSPFACFAAPGNKNNGLSDLTVLDDVFIFPCCCSPPLRSVLVVATDWQISACPCLLSAACT